MAPLGRMHMHTHTLPRDRVPSLVALATDHPAALVDPAHLPGHLSEQPVHDGLAHLDVQLARLPLELQCCEPLQVIHIEHREPRLRRLLGLG